VWNVNLNANTKSTNTTHFWMVVVINTSTAHSVSIKRYDVLSHMPKFPTSDEVTHHLNFVYSFRFTQHQLHHGCELCHVI
jgi:hypothetical protein